ncbi:MAG: hypothetical protein HFG72_07240 [Hungatella sp.]|nr:hypothetical protein [Hungatella sp.]
MNWTKNCLKGQTLIQNKPSISEGYFSASLEKALFCGLSWISSLSMLCAGFSSFLFPKYKKMEPASRGDIGWPVLAGYYVLSKDSPQSAQVTLTRGLPE